MTSLLISLAASTAVCVLFAFLWRRRLRRDLEIESLTKRLRQEVDALVTELNGTTERNVALLEQQIRRLKDEKQEAARAAGVLKRETETHKAADKTYSDLARIRPLQISVEDPSSPDPAVSETVQNPNPATNSSPSPTHPPAPSAEEVSAALNPSGTTAARHLQDLSPREKALMLHRGGAGSDAIAAELNMSRGEVELIISLHERRP